MGLLNINISLWSIYAVSLWSLSHWRKYDIWTEFKIARFSVIFYTLKDIFIAILNNFMQGASLYITFSLKIFLYIRWLAVTSTILMWNLGTIYSSNNCPPCHWYYDSIGKGGYSHGSHILTHWAWKYNIYTISQHWIRGAVAGTIRDLYLAGKVKLHSNVFI